jgi:protein involved in ribonucleotide reduction
MTSIEQLWLSAEALDILGIGRDQSVANRVHNIVYLTPQVLLQKLKNDVKTLIEKDLIWDALKFAIAKDTELKHAHADLTREVIHLSSSVLDTTLKRKSYEIHNQYIAKIYSIFESELAQGWELSDPVKHALEYAVRIFAMMIDQNNGYIDDREFKENGRLLSDAFKFPTIEKYEETLRHAENNMQKFQEWLPKRKRWVKQIEHIESIYQRYLWDECKKSILKWKYREVQDMVQAKYESAWPRLKPFWKICYNEIMYRKEQYEKRLHGTWTRFEWRGDINFDFVLNDQQAYTTLGFTNLPSEEDAKTRYRELAKQFHPDLHAQLWTQEQEVQNRKMVDINNAYDLLKERHWWK